MRTIKPHGQRTLVSVDEAIKRVEGYEPPVKLEPKRENQETIKDEHIRIGELLIQESFHERVEFNQGLRLIKRQGYERYPSPGEYFSMFTHCWGKFDDFAMNLWNAGPCWLNIACEITDSALCIYTNPSNLVPKFNKKKPLAGNYELADERVRCENVEFYPADCLKAGEIHRCNELPRALFKILFLGPGSKADRDLFLLHEESDLYFHAPPSEGVWPMSVHHTEKPMGGGKLGTTWLEPSLKADARGVYEVPPF